MRRHEERNERALSLYLGGLSCQQVAHRMGLTRDTVRGIIRRAGRLRVERPAKPCKQWPHKTMPCRACQAEIRTTSRSGLCSSCYAATGLHYTRPDSSVPWSRGRSVACPLPGVRGAVFGRGIEAVMLQQMTEAGVPC